MSGRIRHVRDQRADRDQVLKIPKGYYVTRVDLESENPECVIIHWDTGEEKVLDIPKTLAYYLTVHFCGSEQMREKHVEMGRDEIRKGIRQILKVDDL